MVAKSRTAYEFIKEQILSGELPPKADISEKNLQEKLNISRTPVHEALKLLEEEHFVETYPRKGTFVSDVTMEVVRDVYDARLLIEPSVTRDAVDLVSREWMLDLHRRLEERYRFQTNQDVRMMISLDTELHTVVASYCTNVFLQKSLSLVYDHDRRLRLKTETAPEQVKFSCQEHIHILDAMLAGDKDLSEKLSREHIINSRKLTIENLGFGEMMH